MLLSACGEEPEAGPVDPTEYDSFFLWAGVRPPPFLDDAKTVYVQSGELRSADNAHIVQLRPRAPQVPEIPIWLVLRVERLDWQDSVYDELLAELAKWEAAGNQLVGLQIDFDAATLRLDGYAAFLEGLRGRMPDHLKLSVTGLMDWSAQGDPAALASLGDIVDEVVIQTYQGRETIPDYETYMDSLARLEMPYRIALVEGGEWRQPESIAADPDFQGYVVFLLPERP